jgi:hypothetical protein
LTREKREYGFSRKELAYTDTQGGGRCVFAARVSVAVTDECYQSGDDAVMDSRAGSFGMAQGLQLTHARQIR